MKLRKDIPDNCTLCGEAFKSKEKKGIFPYPMKEWLCFDCFNKSLSAGLNRLNKVLAGQPLTKEDWESPEVNEK